MLTILPSAARAVSGMAAVTNVPHPERLRGADFQLVVSAAAAAAGDTVNVYVQHSVDGGTTWDDFVSFTQVLGNGGAKMFLAEWQADVIPDSELHTTADGTLAAGVLQGPKGPDWRVKWVMAGAGPNFTFTLGVALKRQRR
jgi:hypothetical protein